MKYVHKTFKEAKNLIEEGDVLLFRGRGLVSYLIQRASGGKYSHVGLASFVKNGDEIIECVEFREFKGGRSVNLERQVIENNGLIDVYRAIPNFSLLNFEHGKTIRYDYTLNSRKITDCMRQMTGLPYGWVRIWWLFKFHAIGFRLFVNGKSFDDSLREEVVYPVCSTTVAHCFHKNYVDLTHNRSNDRMEPADLARSPILNYLFTLTT